MEIRGSFAIPKPEHLPTDQPLISIAHGRYSAPVIADGKLLVRVRDRMFVYNLRSE